MARREEKKILNEANTELSPVQETTPALVKQQMKRNTFTSPTDNIFSPCTQRLVSKRGVAALVLKNRKFVNKVAECETFKENVDQ